MGNKQSRAVEGNRGQSKHVSVAGGFSIFELITVLAIIGFALLVSVGAFGHWGAYWKVRGAQRAVSNALREARSSALAQNRYAAFCYGNVATNEPVARFAYTAYVFTNETVNLETYRGSNDLPSLEGGYQDAPWRFLPEGVSIVRDVKGSPSADPECLILFRPDGTALSPYDSDYETESEAKTHILEVGMGGDSLCITIDLDTGGCTCN